MRYCYSIESKEGIKLSIMDIMGKVLEIYFDLYHAIKQLLAKNIILEKITRLSYLLFIYYQISLTLLSHYYVFHFFLFQNPFSAKCLFTLFTAHEH